MKKELLKKELQHCYSAQAEHFSHTRKKSWPEILYIQEYLQHKKQKNNQEVTILELGCGAGRMYPILKEIYKQELRYIGSDFAPGMIHQAQTTYQGTIISDTSGGYLGDQANRIIADMLDMLASAPDDSVDFIISIASLQHLMSIEQRRLVWLHMYRVLRYDGEILSVNWSYSSWFLKKYWKQQAHSLAQIFLPPRTRSWNDIIITRKDPHRKENKETWRRWYHIFTLHELYELCIMSGFITEKIGYILQNGTYEENNRQESRNTLLIAKKGVFIPSESY